MGGAQRYTRAAAQRELPRGNLHRAGAPCARAVCAGAAARACMCSRQEHGPPHRVFPSAGRGVCGGSTLYAAFTSSRDCVGGAAS